MAPQFRLYYSASIFGAYHMGAMLTATGIPEFYKACVYAGVLSSLWNHSTDSALSQLVDRSLMCACIPIQSYYLWTYIYRKSKITAWVCSGLTAGAASFYLLSKYTNNVSHHIIAHAFITLSNVYMFDECSRHRVHDE